MHVLELSGGQSESKYHARASRWLSKQMKLPMLSSTWKLVYIESYNDPVLSWQTTHARQLCVIIAPSEALNEWSPHHPHSCWQISTKMLMSASLISDPIYQKSRGCGLQNCHPFLGVATTAVGFPQVLIQSFTSVCLTWQEFSRNNILQLLNFSVLDTFSWNNIFQLLHNKMAMIGQWHNTNNTLY